MIRSPKSSRLRLASVSILLLGAAFVAGCRGGHRSGSRDAPSRSGGASAGSASSATGTLTLGPDRYAFRVTRCDLEGSEEDDGPTMYGTGTTEDGASFEVRAERTSAASLGLAHSVSFQSGDVLHGEGTVWEAMRRHGSGGHWSSMNAPGHAADAPLIQIDGRSVTATGTFVNDGTGQQRAGSLEARCP